MTLLKPSEPAFMTAEGAAQRRGYAGRAELRLRNAMEEFLRGRYPMARMCHEMVMGARQVRADLVAVDTAHIVAVEVKGEYDDTTRLLHQVGMYQLCVPEVWMAVPIGRHAEDARIIRHLLPSVGLLVGTGQSGRNHYEFDGVNFGLAVESEPVPRDPVPEMLLEMMWRDELAGVCNRLKISHGQKSTRASMIKALLANAGLPELMAACCAELRIRNALWRADPPSVSTPVHPDSLNPNGMQTC